MPDSASVGRLRPGRSNRCTTGCSPVDSPTAADGLRDTMPRPKGARVVAEVTSMVNGPIGDPPATSRRRELLSVLVLVLVLAGVAGVVSRNWEAFMYRLNKNGHGGGTPTPCRA